MFESVAKKADLEQEAFITARNTNTHREGERKTEEFNLDIFQAKNKLMWKKKIIQSI